MTKNAYVVDGFVRDHPAEGHEIREARPNTCLGQPHQAVFLFLGSVLELSLDFAFEVLRWDRGPFGRRVAVQGCAQGLIVLIILVIIILVMMMTVFGGVLQSETRRGRWIGGEDAGKIRWNKTTGNVQHGPHKLRFSDR